MSTPEIALTNQVPDLFTADDCRKLVLALTAHLPAFCAEHGKTVPVVTYYPSRAAVPEASIEITLAGDPPPADTGVEAYHEDPNGRPDGICFAGYLLAHGGAKFSGELAVSVAWSHEALEYLLNPRTDLILQVPVTAPNGTKYAGIWRECGDPAQGEHVVYQVEGEDVWMAGYVTQSWEDPHGQAPYSVPSGLVKAPLTIGEQGYGGYVDDAGNVATVFAAKAHPVIVELKSAHGRLAAAQKAFAAR